MINRIAKGRREPLREVKMNKVSIPKISELFDLKDFVHKAVFEGIRYPWDVLKPELKSEYIRKVISPNCIELPRERNLVSKTTVIYRGEILKGDFDIKLGSATKGDLQIFKKGDLLKGASVIFAGAFLVGNEIEIGAGCLLEEGTYIVGPTIIGDQTEIRHGSYIRGEVITGKRCVVGHASEIKSSILLNDAKAPHFAYVGDSVLGNKVNLGAGTKVSNLKITGDEISMKYSGGEVSTGLRKFGALIGDHVETGCNSVLNPGVILGKGSMVYPLVAVKKGIYPAKSLIKKDSIGNVR
jgi:UDP-N-acetylglucosamine diphosphorylase / glucose-1-phosphate thymidylyltransferase / UDP-N-acetylgalactosamine diphosphorylase / glucosamine-1-phosphate N-acetyltransferase / galactosamine-1-phosphate N-acetyltransferase